MWKRLWRWFTLANAPTGARIDVLSFSSPVVRDTCACGNEGIRMRVFINGKDLSGIRCWDCFNAILRVHSRMK